MSGRTDISASTTDRFLDRGITLLPSSYDLALRWSSDTTAVRRVDQLGGIPVHAFPHHLRVPGGRILVVAPDGEVLRIGVAEWIDGPRRLKLATGRYGENAYVIRAGGEGMRRPTVREPSKVRIRWHAVGQFRYYDVRRNHAVFISTPTREVPETPLDPVSEVRQPSRRPYEKGIPGLPKGHPESLLVDDYVGWMGSEHRFDRRYLWGDRRWCDLFDNSRWRLIEAKADIDRRNLRTAIGQLLDYRRAFLRSPSLGILVPAHPGKSALEYAYSCGCTVIWRTPTGRFGDSSDSGSWTQRSG